MSKSSPKPLADEQPGEYPPLHWLIDALYSRRDEAMADEFRHGHSGNSYARDLAHERARAFADAAMLVEKGMPKGNKPIVAFYGWDPASADDISVIVRGRVIDGCLHVDEVYERV
jgi:hypothetical protein